MQLMIGVQCLNTTALTEVLTNAVQQRRGIRTATQPNQYSPRQLDAARFQNGFGLSNSSINVLD
jgi:hypothetical protein